MWYHVEAASAPVSKPLAPDAVIAIVTLTLRTICTALAVFNKVKELAVTVTWLAEV